MGKIGKRSLWRRLRRRILPRWLRLWLGRRRAAAQVKATAAREARRRSRKNSKQTILLWVSAKRPMDWGNTLAVARGICSGDVVVHKRMYRKDLKLLASAKELVAQFPVDQIMARLKGGGSHMVLPNGDTVPVTHVLRVFRRHGIVCQGCGLKGSVFKEWQTVTGVYVNLFAVAPDGEHLMMTVDHITPRARGGTGRLDNLQPMCSKCNTLKADGSTATTAAAAAAAAALLPQTPFATDEECSAERARLIASGIIKPGGQEAKS